MADPFVDDDVSNPYGFLNPDGWQSGNAGIPEGFWDNEPTPGSQDNGLPEVSLPIEGGKMAANNNSKITWPDKLTNDNSGFPVEVPEDSRFIWLGGNNTEIRDAEGNLVDSHPITEEEKEELASHRTEPTPSLPSENGEPEVEIPPENISTDILDYDEWCKEQDLGHGSREDYENYLKSRGVGGNGAAGNNPTTGSQEGGEPVVEIPPENTSADILDYDEWKNGNEHGTWDGYLNYLNSKGVETFKSTVDELQPDYGNGSFRTQDIENMISGFGAAANSLENVMSSARNIASEYEKINEDTRKKLAGTEVGDGAQLQAEIIQKIENMQGFALDIKSDLQTILNKIGGADGTPPGSEEPPYIPTPVNIDDGSESYHDSSSSGGGSSASDVPEIIDPTTDTTQDVLIESAVVGTLTFSAIVPLFEELGKPSTIQSSLTGEYDVVGIFLYEGKYYYRVYDKNLKKFYFAEIDNNSNFTTEYTDLLKMNEDAMMLSSTDIGQNVLTKMTDINEVYFVNGTLPGEGDTANITFANILDGMDGKNYYVPLSDSVEMVTLDVFKAGILGDTTTLDTNASMDVSNNVG